MRVPSFVPPRTVQPRRLNEWVRQSEAGSSATPPASRDLVIQAKQLHQKEQQLPGSCVPTRRLVPALIELLSEPGFDSRLICTLVLRVRGLGWRHIWPMWAHLGDEDPRLARMLESTISKRSRASKSFRSRLPTWLPVDDSALLRSTLERPVERLRAWVPQQNARLQDVGRTTQLSAGSWILRELYPALIRFGSDSWWALSSAEELRGWADATPAHRAQVCDRLLVEAVPPGSVERSVEGTKLLNWTLRGMGDPYKHPGQWAEVSIEGKDAFERLHLANVLNDILVQFQKDADHDRAEFWAGWFGAVTDARFYRATDGAVCMMVLRNKLYIEFGNTGNACYAYHPRPGARPLRTLHIPEAKKMEWFKSKSAIVLGGQELAFAKWLTHQGDWQQKFTDYFVMGS